MQNKIKLIIWLAACWVAAILAYFTESVPMKLALLGATMYSTYKFKFTNPIFLYIGISLSAATMESFMAIMLISLPLYLNKRLFTWKEITPHLPIIALIGFLGFISFATGIQANPNTMMLFFMGIYLLIVASSKPFDTEELFYYMVFTFFVVAGILFMQLLRGEIFILYGRLAIDGNIRDLADMVAIPTFASFGYLMVAKTSIRQKILYISVGFISSFLLLATLSKGAIITVIASLAVIYARSGKITLGKALGLLIVAGVLYFIFNFVKGIDTLSAGRLFEEDEGFSGRTDIWDTYYSSMVADPIHALFGFGPGDVRRLNLSEYYSHSLFFDVLFSYGYVMFLFLSFVLLKLGFYVYKSKNCFAFGLFVFTCLIYATHGVCTHNQFYILIGLSIALAKETYNDHQYNYAVTQ